MISIETIDALTSGRLGTFDIPCRECGPSKHTAMKQRKRVMRVWRSEPGFAGYHCARCGASGFANDRGGTPPDAVRVVQMRAEITERERAENAERLRTAKWLWSRRRPIAGTIAEVYLRARGFRGLTPPTLAFLPAWRDHPPAMIAAFGMVGESEPGMLAPIATDSLLGVHLVKLRPDGTDRLREIDDAKVTIGRGFVAPIVLAPPNDLLAITIAEGVEDGLSDHQISGAGAWAAASAGRMPGLAALVPSYIECVTILVDNNDAGRVSSHTLAAALHAREIEVLLAGKPS